MRVIFSKISDKYNFANKCNFIQNNITLYFHAMITFVFKSIKFETFAFTHVRENVFRQFSIFHFISFTSFFFRFLKIFRSFSVCKHCQKRFVIYWFIDWVTSNVTKIENNKIFMKMRYWRFVFFRFVLKKYWFFYFEKVIILKKSTCCLFVCCLFVHFFYQSLIDHDLKKHKSCCCFNEFDVSSFSFCDLKRFYKLLYVLFICFIV